MSLRDLQEFVKNYNIAVYRLMASGRSAPSESRLEQFEESIGFRFPDEFRELTLSPLGGLCLQVCDDLWPRPGSTEVEEWQRLYSLNLFGIAAGVPEWLDLREELALLPPEESDLVPFLSRGCEKERYCFDLDHQLVRWCPATGRRELIKNSFYGFLLHEIAELEVRRQRYMDEALTASKKARKRTRSKVC
ncbi:MAG: SMI1/KNR4 family protein [Vulcanimicrobiota bacterium]